MGSSKCCLILHQQCISKRVLVCRCHTHLNLLSRWAAHWVYFLVCSSNHSQISDRRIFGVPLLCCCFTRASFNWSYSYAILRGWYFFINLWGSWSFGHCKNLAVDTGGCLRIEYLDHSIIVMIFVIPALNATLIIALIALNTWVVFLRLWLGWRATDANLVLRLGNTL